MTDTQSTQSDDLAPPPTEVLIVDNDEAHAQVVAESLERVGFACHVATSGNQGAEMIEGGEFDVVITAVGDKKIQVIKVVRAITGLGLKEAKALVDELPGNVKESASKEEADDVVKQLEEAGATVEVK